MESNVLKYIFRFVGLIALQILILNHMQLGGYINPYVYPLFILLLPFDTKGWILLILAFALGLSIDMFSNSAGMHASACVFMAFLRPTIIRALSTRTDFEAGTEPRTSVQGSGWVFLFTLLLIFIHHLALFFLEVFRFNEIAEILLKSILSTGISVMLIMLIHFLLGSPEKKRSWTR